MSSIFSITTLRAAMFGQLSTESTAECPGSGVAEASKPQLLRCPQDSSKIRAALNILLSLSKPKDCATETSSSENIRGGNGSKKLCSESGDDSRTSHLCSDSNNSVQAVGQKSIVFSQWTGMLDLLESCLKSNNIQYRRLDGTMPISARDRAVKDFNLLPEVCMTTDSLIIDSPRVILVLIVKSLSSGFGYDHVSEGCESRAEHGGSLQCAPSGPMVEPYD